MAGKQMYDVDDPTVDALKASAFAQRIYTKRVRGPEDLGKWKRSSAYYDLVAYINNTSMVIQGHRQTGGYVITKQMRKLCKIFNWLERLVYECHPLGVGQGLLRCVGQDKIDLMESTNSLRHKCHRAYKNWIKMVQEKIFSVLERQVAPHCKHINELAQYLSRSFGSLQHYNYGPNNELMFVFYLCGLFKSGILVGEDTAAAALLLFQRYLDLVRRLMTFFRLPATCLRDNNTIDERNILPYIWGCAQLCRSQPFAPPQWEQPSIIAAHRKDYMLISSLEYLQKTMDNGALGVHSYQLWCVLSLSNWPDAYSGLMNTYLKDVLNDFYTVQDLIFCEMLSFTRQPLEALQRAFLGDLPHQETSTSSTQSTEKDDGDDSVEQEHETKQKKKVNMKDHALLPLNPPVELYKKLNTNVFLGYSDARNGIDPEEVSHPNALIRRRMKKEMLLQKSSTVMFPERPLLMNIESSESDYDMVKLNALLGIDPSTKSTTMSFYSI